MEKKIISRNEFFTKALTAIAGASLISKNMSGFLSPGPELRAVGKTGIMVSPICFGAPRVNDESLIKYAPGKRVQWLILNR
jgi:hypothetical protein